MQLQKAKYWIVLVFASLLMACSSSGPESVAENFISSLYKGDIDGLLKVVHMTRKEQAEIRDSNSKMNMMLKLMRDEIEEQGGLKSVKAFSTEYSDDKKKAEVELEIKLGNGDTKDETVHLGKIDGKWKVLPN